MAFYTNSKADSPIASIEFSPVAEGNFSFFTLKSTGKKEAIKQWLTSPSIEQEIIAETIVDGRPVLVTHGDRSAEELLKILAQRGDMLTAQPKTRRFNWWAGRGALSMAGQLLQLVSGFLVKGPPDGATITFAFSNIAANISNIVFGAQKSEDLHRLRFLKTEINDDLYPHLPAGISLPAVEDSRADALIGPKDPQTTGDKLWSFMEKHSVRIGEIGLRYFGSLALVFPVTRWKKGADALGQGGIAKSLQEMKNPDKFTLWAGMAYVTGKTLALASKTPDPYDPKPHSVLDTIREKYVFRASTLIETAAAGIISWDRFANRKIKFPDKAFIPASLRGAEKPDFVGGIGGALFVAAFAMRFFAPFGVKRIDMEELQAHIADSIAKTPPDKLTQLMADTASTVKEHLKDKDLSYGEIFTGMMTDLYRYHHIALDNLGTEPEERLAGLGKSVTAQKVLINEPGQQLSTAKKILAKTPRGAMDRVNTPAASHEENIVENAKTTQAHPAIVA
jgi:hypothetical protein